MKAVTQEHALLFYTVSFTLIRYHSLNFPAVNLAYNQATELIVAVN